MNRSWQFSMTMATVLVAGGCGRSVQTVTADTKGIPAGAPAVQQKFCEKIIAWIEEFARRDRAEANEPNPLKKEALQKQRAAKGPNEAWDDLYALIGPDGEFKDWRGRPDLRRADDGRLELVVRIGSLKEGGVYVSLKTGRRVYGRGGVDTSIPPDGTLAQTLATLDVTKDVVVSGKFVWIPELRVGEGERPGVNDQSHFVGAHTALNVLNIRRPIFMVRFTSIAQAR